MSALIVIGDKSLAYRSDDSFSRYDLLIQWALLSPWGCRDELLDMVVTNDEDGPAEMAAEMCRVIRLRNPGHRIPRYRVWCLDGWAEGTGGATQWADNLGDLDEVNPDMRDEAMIITTSQLYPDATVLALVGPNGPSRDVEFALTIADQEDLEIVLCQYGKAV